MLTQKRNDDVKSEVRNRITPANKVNKGTTIEITNLSTDIQTAELIQLFEQFGSILRLNIFWKKESNTCESRITFQDFNAAKEAQANYNKAELDNREIEIKLL